MLDVNALRVVRAIGDEGGFTAAANALGLQPAGGEPAGPPPGEAPRHGAGRAARAVRAAHRGRARCSPGTRSRCRARSTPRTRRSPPSPACAPDRVRVMAFPSSSASVVPRALADLRARHPGLQVTFSEGEPPQSLAALRSGECDVAVAFTYPGTGAGRDVDDLSGLLTVPLLDDELHVVLPASHELAGRAADRPQGAARPARSSPAAPAVAATSCRWPSARASSRGWSSRPTTTWP